MLMQYLIFKLQANSVDPDQTARQEAVWYGFTLFAIFTSKDMTVSKICLTKVVQLEFKNLHD